MALQGNLHDFAVSEILQLLGTQRKTGCLVLEGTGMRARIYVTDGRLVATRQPGLAPDDPLLRFLRRAGRLSEEQQRGIQTIHQQSQRDLEDLLVSGSYLDTETLAAFVERQILDDMMRIAGWQNGSYLFDPALRWPNPALTSMSIEGALIEVARRVDEQQRFAEMFRDSHQLLGVREMPDLEEHLSEEECEMFGAIDGRHTVAEVVAAAPLSDFEATEALHRMVESGWVEAVGRREPGEPAAAPLPTEPAAVRRLAQDRALRMRPSLVREMSIAGLAVALAIALWLGGRQIESMTAMPEQSAAFEAGRLERLRVALALYDRERDHYPDRLEELVAERYVARDHLRFAGRTLTYRRDAARRGFRLALEPIR